MILQRWSARSSVSSHVTQIIDCVRMSGTIKTSISRPGHRFRMQTRDDTRSHSFSPPQHYWPLKKRITIVRFNRLKIKTASLAAVLFLNLFSNCRRRGQKVSFKMLSIMFSRLIHDFVLRSDWKVALFSQNN